MSDPAAPASSGFQQLAEREIHHGRVIRVVAGRFRAPDGEEFERDIVRSPGAVAVVAVLDDGHVVVVRQYRPAIGAWLLEIPAGLRDKAGEPPEVTAARELAEEAGFAAERYELLVDFANAAGMTDQRTLVYLATGLREVPTATEGIEEQYLSVERVRLEDVDRLVAAGEVSDAKTVIGLLLARERLRRR